MSTPLVSVVLTNHNGERFVRQAMESVLAQTYTNWEMIVVDDASTDQSVRLIQQVQDPRIRLVVNERNSHVSFSHNTGNALCKGEYIAALDYDDLWKPDKLEKQVTYMEAHPETGACFSYLDIINENGDPVEDPQTLSLYQVENRDRIAWLRELLTVGNHFANDSSLIRREVMEKIGENSLSLIQLHDYDMWVHIALHHELYILPEPLMSYRRLTDGSSITSGSEYNIRQAYFEYSWIVGRVIRDMEDDLFRQVFATDLLRPDLDTPLATRCEKALCLRRDHELTNTKELAFGLLSDLLQEKESRDYLWQEFHISQHEIYTLSREAIQVDPMVQEKMLGYDILRNNDPYSRGPLGAVLAPAVKFLSKHPQMKAGVKAAKALVKGGPGAAKEIWKNRNSRAGKLHDMEASVAKPQADICSESINFSILVSLHNPSPEGLEAMLRSVQHQSYGSWKLYLRGSNEESQALAIKDARIHYTRQAQVISDTGSWIILLDQEDVLHPDALQEITQAISEGNADFVYTDENSYTEKPEEAGDAHYKPDFAPDTLRSVNYIGSFIAFDQTLLNSADELDAEGYDLILRLTERAKHIVHIPKVLISHRSTDMTVSAESEQKAVQDQLNRLGLKGRVEEGRLPGTHRIRYDIQGNPLVSIIIPTREHKADLQRCLDSIFSRSTWKNLEVILVENGSSSRENLDYYEEVKQKYGVKVIVWQRAFNFSGLCNFGFSASRGEYVVLLNNDVEIITPDWIQEMLMYAQRKDVGAVGALLYYPNDTVQHAGLILGVQEIAGQPFKHMMRGAPGYHGRLGTVQNLTAVTGACMMIPRHIYLRVNGYNKDFMVAFNDVDFCLRVRKAGYLVVFTPYAELYHHESLSRGSEEKAYNHARFVSEIARFHSLWDNELKAGDPYYNPNFSREMADFSTR